MKRNALQPFGIESLMESEFKSTLPTIFIFLHIMQSLHGILAFVLVFTFQATTKLNSILIYEKVYLQLFGIEKSNGKWF